MNTDVLELSKASTSKPPVAPPPRVASRALPLSMQTTAHVSKVIGQEPTTTPPPDFNELKTSLRQTTNEGADHLERRIGEMVIRDMFLLQQSGQLLASKLVKSTGWASVSGGISAIYEIGCGLYPGLGISIALALTQEHGFNPKDLKVIASSWEHPQLSPIFPKNNSGTGPSVLVVTSARIVASAKKLNDFITELKLKVGVGVNIAGIISLVCLEEEGTAADVGSAGGGQKIVSYVDGMKIID